MSKREVSERSAKLTISLTSLLRAQESESGVRRALRPFIDSSQIKRDFAVRVIEKILQRTNSGIDKDGARFAGYSKAYKKSLMYQIYKNSSTPNLRLTGDMQASIETLEIGDTSVTIGIRDADDAVKAYAHIRGRGPHGRIPKRDFFDLPPKEQYKIFQETIRDFNSFIPVEDLDVTVNQNITEAGSQLDLDLDVG